VSIGDGASGRHTRTFDGDGGLGDGSAGRAGRRYVLRGRAERLYPFAGLEPGEPPVSLIAGGGGMAGWKGVAEARCTISAGKLRIRSLESPAPARRRRLRGYGCRGFRRF